LCTVFIVVLLRDLRTRAFLEHIESAERARKAKESTVYTELRLKTYMITIMIMTYRNNCSNKM
jgi:hypothetical protein